MTWKGEDCVIHYNTDLSGDIQICPNDKDKNIISIPGSDILAFVADYVKDRRMEKLEELMDNMTPQELFGI